MTDKKDEWRKAFKYITLSTEIPIMAFLGYIIGKRLGGQELIGAFVGLVLGTLLMWYSVMSALRRIEK